MPVRDLRCGKCNASTSCSRGYHGSEAGVSVSIYICHKCGTPNYFDVGGMQIPGPAFGGSVDHISDSYVKALYDEARRCTSANSYTAAVMCCRKLLMNIAVSKGAKEGLHFIEYIEFLAKNNYIPPNSQGWIDHIRKKGNEANHEIRLMTNEDAEELVEFLEMLLKFIYEFPERTKKRISPKSPQV